MSAAETIQAAIDKLEARLGNTTTGPWEQRGAPGGTPWIEAHGQIIVGTVYAPVDADLIETLHRTIDPILAILQRGSTAYSPMYFPVYVRIPGWVAEARALSLPLARAILGEAS